MRSLVMSAPCSSAITTPRCRTMHAGAQPLQLGAVRGAHDGGRALRRRQVDEAVDVGLRPDVDALRRLVEHEHPRRAAEPAGHDDLLLVAARELADDRLGPRGRTSSSLDPDRGVRRSRRRGRRRPPAQNGRRSPMVRFSRTASSRNSPAGPRSAGTKAQAGVDRPLAGRTAGIVVAVDRHSPRARAAAGQQAGQLVAAGAGRGRRCRRPRRGATSRLRSAPAPPPTPRTDSDGLAVGPPVGRAWAADSATSSRPSIRLTRLVVVERRRVPRWRPADRRAGR